MILIKNFIKKLFYFTTEIFLFLFKIQLKYIEIFFSNNIVFFLVTIPFGACSILLGCVYPIFLLIYIGIPFHVISFSFSYMFIMYSDTRLKYIILERFGKTYLESVMGNSGLKMINEGAFIAVGAGAFVLGGEALFRELEFHQLQVSQDLVNTAINTSKLTLKEISGELEAIEKLKEDGILSELNRLAFEVKKEEFALESKYLEKLYEVQEPVVYKKPIVYDALSHILRERS